MKRVRTTCPYCGVGCGIRAAVGAARAVTIEGDPAHPANAGRLCSKGTQLAETVGLEGRLLHPEVEGRRTGWDKAIRHVARNFGETIARHGPDSVAFYVSGQLLTEDYYVANKLMKGFVGSANIDTNSRLCMSSAVAGHLRAFGEDVVPASYEDLDQADIVVLVGSNTAWCHPVVYQRIMAARASRGTKLVVIDPRRTETCEEADLHLPLRSGSDVALMNGLLAYCREAGVLDQAFLDAHVNTPEGFWDALGQGTDLWSTATACDLPPGDLRAFFELFVRHPRTVTLFSQGINQSIRGTDQVNAIVNVHLATGRIGKPGAAPFSITGQPNAMGGREVGGLASTLAAHMDFAPENVAKVQRFRAAPHMATKPGLKAVDMFRAVSEGRVKALWIMATNPAASLPDASLVREALAHCPFVAVSDCIADTNTSRFAHVKLPAAAWGEKDGTVTNSERVISRQRTLFPPPGEAKPDWWIVAQVARAMGWRNAFGYEGPAEIYREHARLSAYRNEGRRLFDLGFHGALSNRDYDAMEPTRWGATPFADGRFSTQDGKARLVAVAQRTIAKPLRKYPLTLNTGRYRDQWHTMTRSGLSPRLSQHRREPLVDHPLDAEAAGIGEGDLVEVHTPQGSSVFRALHSKGQRPGEIFTPIHWTDRQSNGGRSGLLAGPQTDPHSGQPGFKSTPARIERFALEWQGFLIAREVPEAIPADYYTKVRVGQGWLVELAGSGDPALLATQLLPKGELVETIDAARGTMRMAVLDPEGRLAAALYVTRNGKLPDREWLIAQLAASEAAPTIELLAGRPSVPGPDRGTLVCACFDVGMKTILSAIASQSLTSVEAVGRALSAGTNCGSCRPAIQHLIGQTKEAASG